MSCRSYKIFFREIVESNETLLEIINRLHSENWRHVVWEALESDKSFEGDRFEVIAQRTVCSCHDQAKARQERKPKSP